MDFVPHTDAERASMLGAIGVDSLEDLFRDLPRDKFKPDLDLPPPCTELDIATVIGGYAKRNRSIDPGMSFLGAGTYQHHRPAVVDSILRRGEFSTSYTPYQPELSQGFLQAMFEYQSMICRLTEMEVSNASHYDGATALAEAVLMAIGERAGRRKVVVSETVHPRYRQVMQTYLRGTDATMVLTPSVSAVDCGAVADRDTAAVVIQNPNFFGRFEDVEGLAEAIHAAGALFVVVADPISLGLFQPPGAYGADIVVADGQALGLPPSFGGPHLGIIATRGEHVRKLAGRIVGETTDGQGRRGYVLTLATREQHIRRAKATSNICTNSALTALGAAVYLAVMGKAGLKQVADLCYQKSHYAADQIARIPGCSINPGTEDRPFFREFVVDLPKPAVCVNTHLLDCFGIVGGYDLGRAYAGCANQLLVAVTELNPRASIDRLVEGLRYATA